MRPERSLIAHIRRDGKEQSLVDHLVEVSSIAGSFAAKVRLSDVGKTAGLLHDLGKASKEYQDYLRTSEGVISPDMEGYSPAKRGEIDHSTAGAQLAFEKLEGRGQEGKILAEFLALIIASHHSGLIDCLKPDGSNELKRRITKHDSNTHLAEARSKLSEIERQLDEILSQPMEKHFCQILFEGEPRKGGKHSRDGLWFERGLMARFVLSCLLDADRLSTADFESPGNKAVRNYGKYVGWDTLVERLEARYVEYAQEGARVSFGPALEVNLVRAQVAEACLKVSEKAKGIYQLTVPTGGGKTEASLRFALHHARAHGMERIFYVVPYTTIIDQNADKVRKITERRSERGKIVLEHHSNFVPEEDTRRRHDLLAEDWDAPIVFTTQVRFLEVLFGAGTRDARRMHQLANSVIVFDEVQTIPMRITHMFTGALRFLTERCGCTVVLCTATQPPFDNTGNRYRDLGLSEKNHIIRNPRELFKRMKRVEVYDARRPGGLSNEDIADLAERALAQKGSVLIVVNTRASARALYEAIKGRPLSAAVFHLSNSMCPAHRMDVLERELRPRLGAKERVVCVSTQLIEAGVDIDFGAVIRALAGLDSVAQSAGRCNRHGMRGDGGSVWVVNPREENLDQLPEIKVEREHAQRVLDDFRDAPAAFADDRIGLDAVASYYRFYYQSQTDKMNYPVDAYSSLGRNDNLFNLLSRNTLSVSAHMNTYRAAPSLAFRQSFRTANREFRVINSAPWGTIVPYKHGAELIKKLRCTREPAKLRKLLREAQRYSINLFDHEVTKLREAEAIQEVVRGEGIYCLDGEYYSDDFGWSDRPVRTVEPLIE